MADTDTDTDQSLTDLAAGLLAGQAEGGTEPGEGAGERQPEAGEGEGGDGTPEGTTPEGTEGAEEPGEGEGATEGETGQDEISAEPTYTVKIDGQDVRVTLKEALSGYQRNLDYTRKTEEVAKARKALETELGAAQLARDQYGAVLKLVQERLGAADQELTAEQWNQLRQTDPARYTVEYADFQRRTEQRRAVADEQKRIADEARVVNLHKAHEYLQGERAKLHAALPILADPDKGPTELKSLRSYAARTFGFTEQEMDQAYDHRMILAIDKARRWDAHVAALGKAKAKMTEAPQLPAPGPRVQSPSSKAAARTALQKQFEKTGNPDDAAALLLMQ